MLTLILEEPGRIVVRDVPAPGAPGPGEALVRVHRIGVCGTDLHAFIGDQPFINYPLILGHELGVEVLAVGAGVGNVRPGERCALEPYLNCGRCSACTRGRTNCCRSLRVLGVHTDGGHRARLLVPARKLHVSATLDYDQLALVETLGIGAHAVARAEVQPGETVAVIGAGPIGLAVMQFALAAGARVIAVDVNASRLAFCRSRIGVTDSVDARAGYVVAQLEALTAGDLPTAVFDATGSAKSMKAAFVFPAQGGRLVLVGLAQAEVTFSDPDLHRRELSVLASRNSLSTDFVRIIHLIEGGRIDTAPWITHRATLTEVPALFAAWTLPATGVIKAMIEVPDR